MTSRASLFLSFSGGRWILNTCEIIATTIEMQHKNAKEVDKGAGMSSLVSKTNRQVLARVKTDD